MNKCVAYMFNLTAYLGSTAMNYPRSKFSKLSYYFLINYGYCSNCATCAISGKVAGTRGNRWKLLKDDLKCYI